jgi:uncharacterized protein
VFSRFLGKDVQFVMKGRKDRKCDPSFAFPDLKATLELQDGYPLLVATEESLKETVDAVRGMVGQKGVSEEWKEKELPMRRYADHSYSLLAGLMTDHQVPSQYCPCWDRHPLR